MLGSLKGRLLSDKEVSRVSEGMQLAGCQLAKMIAAVRIGCWYQLWLSAGWLRTSWCLLYFVTVGSIKRVKEHQRMCLSRAHSGVESKYVIGFSLYAPIIPAAR